MGYNLGGGVFSQIMSTANRAEERRKEEEARAYDMMQKGFINPNAQAPADPQGFMGHMSSVFSPGQQTRPEDYQAAAFHPQVAEGARNDARILSSDTQAEVTAEETRRAHLASEAYNDRLATVSEGQLSLAKQKERDVAAAAKRESERKGKEAVYDRWKSAMEWKNNQINTPVEILKEMTAVDQVFQQWKSTEHPLLDWVPSLGMGLDEMLMRMFDDDTQGFAVFDKLRSGLLTDLQMQGEKINPYDPEGRLTPTDAEVITKDAVLKATRIAIDALDVADRTSEGFQGVKEGPLEVQSGIAPPFVGSMMNGEMSLSDPTGGGGEMPDWMRQVGRGARNMGSSVVNSMMGPQAATGFDELTGVNGSPAPVPTPAPQSPVVPAPAPPPVDPAPAPPPVDPAAQLQDIMARNSRNMLGAIAATIFNGTFGEGEMAELSSMASSGDPDVAALLQIAPPPSQADGSFERGAR